MPQKKSLWREWQKPPCLYHLLALLTVLKGLPLTYNKDLQEDKELPLIQPTIKMSLTLCRVMGRCALIENVCSRSRGFCQRH